VSKEAALSRGVSAHQAGDLAAAEFYYKLVLASDKKQFDALHLLGVVDAQRGNFPEALRQLTAAVRIRPNSVDALVNLGGVQVELRENEHAVATLKRALKLDARSVLANNNLSIALRRLRRLDEALVHASRAVELNPRYADAWNNRANVLYDLKRLDEAFADYNRALAIDGRMAQAFIGRGNLFKEREQLQDALADYDRAIALQPMMLEAWEGRAALCERMGRFKDALEANEKILSIKPNTELVEGARLFNKRQCCQWGNIEAEQAEILAKVRSGLSVISPLCSLILPASPADLQRIAVQHNRREHPGSTNPVWRGERYAHERIRVAYLSADLRDHPVAYLLAGVIERHDRRRFEAIGISFSPRDESEMRRRLEAKFDRFIDVDRQGDDEVARLLRELEVDIAVDLMGYTTRSRTRIYAHRPAPVQATFLGYAGGTGADYMDYILADRVVIPDGDRQFYSEKVVWLPDTFMPTDDTRVVAEHVASRSEEGLPDDGFVYCSFNQSHKFTPDVFTVWMRLLAAVDGSVLWLSRINETAMANLRREAVARGIDGGRLVFARRVESNADHLARHGLADLFLNTTPYNAHGGAADALWAGLPVVTDIGPNFAGRVTASLLHAVGLPELIAPSLEDYEALALQLAQDRGRLASIKAWLASDGKRSVLFDTARFTRHLEAAYTQMTERSRRGDAPESFAVTPIG
jgi:predicted O-linked N-acetylglucosamine transferase (SPINDLY family)